MNIRILVAAAMVAGIAACGSSPAATTPVTGTRAESSTSSVSAVTTTTSLKRVIVLPTTTTIEVTRDSRLAVGRCTDAMGPLFAKSVTVDAGRLDAAQSACDNAKLQLEADGVVVLDYSQPASDLLAALEFMNVTLGFAAVKVAGDSFDPAAQATLQKAADDFDAKVQKLLALLL